MRLKLKARWALIIIFMAVCSSVQSEPFHGIMHRTVVFVEQKPSELSHEELGALLPGFSRVEQFKLRVQERNYRLSVKAVDHESVILPDVAYLADFGRGIDKAYALKIQNYRYALVLDVAYPERDMINGLKMADQFIYRLAQKLNGVIWDDETQELFSLAAWKLRRNDAWYQNIALMESHILIHSEMTTPESIDIQSLGMAKFGLPDLRIHDFPYELLGSMANLMNLTAQSLFEGIKPDDAGILQLSFQSLKESPYKVKLLQSLGWDNKVNVNVGLKGVPLLTVDEESELPAKYPNLVLEITFDHIAAPSRTNKQIVVLSNLFRKRDSSAHHSKVNDVF